MRAQPLIRAVGDRTPQISPDAYTAPTCVVLGEVVLAAGASLWYNTVVRADWETISIGGSSNIQDNSTLHADPLHSLTVGRRVTVGHNSVLHGCTIEDDTLVGMHSTVLNGAHIEAGCLIAAQSLVPQGMRIPAGSFVSGAPAEVKRSVTAAERQIIRLSADAYEDLAQQHASAHSSPS
ncbi:gamma carbonic anhydrase family protein [Streptomyces sp. NPDC012769]|uniref:gamma carbonic anhydrase family protein n=1 Tax=Streptomyces sp. NPDC012769 TaxID=3364848 RepID=UPI0036CE58C5